MPGSSLWYSGEDGYRHLTLPPFEWDTLDHERDEQRFLVLHPCAGDRNDVAAHVRCDLENTTLFDAKPFIAVSNARGYRLLEEAIEISGTALLVPVALERFLRHFRRTGESVRLWVRHLCVNQANGEERARYWTRGFSDTMYDLATEVVNMSQYVSELVEEKVVETFYDTRYCEWDKEWYNWLEPEEVRLPKVFPIRLGKQCSNETPTDDYEYMPLDMVADEIRVLLLTPSEDRSAPIVCHLAHCPLASEVTFVALSYIWGQDDTKAEIVLNGQKTLIRRSLEDVFRALRFPDKVTPLWVDAICINQADVVERNRQLPRMIDVYDHAAAVTSYIGGATDDDNDAIELIKELNMPMMRHNDRGEWHFGPWNVEHGKHWFGENPIGPARLSNMCVALYKFFMRPYFRRVWVLQELARASSPNVGVGDSFGLRFEQLDMAAYHLQDMLRSDPSLAGKMYEADSTLGKVDLYELAFVRKLFYLRHLACNGTHPSTMIAQFAKIRDTAPAFLETLVLARDFQATDPRDKIYALWNLAQDKVGLDFRMDYSKSMQETFIDFASAWIKQHRSLDIIAAVERTESSGNFYETGPSWCPDWSEPSASSCLVRRERIPIRMMPYMDDLDGELYAADGGVRCEAPNSPVFEVDGDILLATGIVLDEIKLTFDNPPKISKMMRFPDCDPESYHKFMYWVATIERYYATNSLTIYNDPCRAATAMFHGDLEAAWPPREENPHNVTDDYPSERYVCLPAASRHIRFHAPSYQRADAWDVVRSVIRGRVPFVSQSGYMGLAPTLVRKATTRWLLAVVATCSVPLLLRERDDGCFELHGTCFVQGWMEGEMLTSMMGADNPQEFWDAVKDGSKLRLS